jgi:hypothetical protein
VPFPVTLVWMRKVSDEQETEYECQEWNREYEGDEEDYRGKGEKERIGEEELGG